MRGGKLEFNFLSKLVFNRSVWSSELKEEEPNFVLLFVSFQIRVGALSSELSELRSQLDHAASAHHRELQSLQETCSDLRSRAEVALKEANDSIDVLKARCHFQFIHSGNRFLQYSEHVFVFVTAC